MGRVTGRFFTNDYELKRTFRDIRQEQEDHGTEVRWYYYQGAVPNDLYAEGGRRWDGPHTVEVISAVPEQGENVPSDSGRYVTDRIILRISYRQFSDESQTADISTFFEQRYNDRFEFRGHIYGVEGIRVDGHFDPEARDVVIQVTGGQLRPDELVDDYDFAAFASSTGN